MKNIVLIIGLATILFSCNQSYETKLIDAPYDKNISTEAKQVEKINIKAIIINEAWFLDFKSKRKNKPTTPFQNIEIHDSIDKYYITTINTKEVLIPKKDALLNLTAKVVLVDLQIFSKPELTKKTEEIYQPGTILLISTTFLNDFYKVKKYKEKNWSFLRKKEDQFSNQEIDLTIANEIMEINKNKDVFIKNKLFEELRLKKDFNRQEWIPIQDEILEFNDEEPML